MAQAVCVDTVMGAAGPPPHARLTRISRWSSPDPYDFAVTAALTAFCFGGPFFFLLTLLVPLLLLLPLVLMGWVTAEAAWFAHRWYLRVAHEPWTAPDAFPERRQHMRRFLLLKDDVVPCIKEFAKGWFRGADASLIRRDNMREFVRYAFYGSVGGALGDTQEAEIEWWLMEVEKTWGVTFEPGRTEGLQFMAHMREPLWAGAYTRPLFSST